MHHLNLFLFGLVEIGISTGGHSTKQTVNLSSKFFSEFSKSLSFSRYSRNLVEQIDDPTIHSANEDNLLRDSIPLYTCYGHAIVNYYDMFNYCMYITLFTAIAIGTASVF